MSAAGIFHRSLRLKKVEREEKSHTVSFWPCEQPQTIDMIEIYILIRTVWQAF